MTNDFMIEMALNHFGFNDAEKARIMAAIPKLSYVLKLAKNNKTVANELIDVGEMIATKLAERT